MSRKEGRQGRGFPISTVTASAPLSNGQLERGTEAIHAMMWVAAVHEDEDVGREHTHDQGHDKGQEQEQEQEQDKE